MYFDVHTHLSHERFQDDLDQVIVRALAAGLETIVENGLDPRSNRHALELAKRYPQIKPALGIYPLNAVNHLIPEDFALDIPKFDVDEELAFIDQQASQGLVFAIGECGLDGYWLDASTFAQQEKVFEQLIEIAQKHALPLIIHTRKLEQRSAEILAHHHIERVNFHCFGGKVRLAQRWSEKYGWWFSIPTNIKVNEAFQRMVDLLPADRLLTETDAPYLAPTKGTRNEPANIPGTIEIIAQRKGLSHTEAQALIKRNFDNLFYSS